MVTLSQEKKDKIEQLIFSLIKTAILQARRIDDFSNHPPTDKQIEGVKMNCLELIHIYFKPGIIKKIEGYASPENDRIIIEVEIDFSIIENHLQEEVEKMTRETKGASQVQRYLN